tara:strand:+ start:26 stop:544 length:519 start_codon:yes stop_codon:yes gene_type:complete
MPFKLKFLSVISLLIFLNSCGGLSKVDTRKVPVNVQERARKNVEEGRAAGIGGILKGGRNTFQFSSSNPMWRASLEILDFMPLTTVDYSGGMIISDWYSESAKSNESIKISVRFLASEVRSDSIKVIVHKKNCSTQQTCKTILLNNSKIKEELTSSILRKAVLLKNQDKKKN